MLYLYKKHIFHHLYRQAEPTCLGWTPALRMDLLAWPSYPEIWTSLSEKHLDARRAGAHVESLDVDAAQHHVGETFDSVENNSLSIHLKYDSSAPSPSEDNEARHLTARSLDTHFVFDRMAAHPGEEYYPSSHWEQSHMTAHSAEEHILHVRATSAHSARSNQTIVLRDGDTCHGIHFAEALAEKLAASVQLILRRSGQTCPDNRCVNAPVKRLAVKKSAICGKIQTMPRVGGNSELVATHADLLDMAKV
jgi:hypothetical protein